MAASLLSKVEPQRLHASVDTVLLPDALLLDAVAEELLDVVDGSLGCGCD